MTDRPYHHGRLRATLLAEAERTLREQGTEALSLRDLARQAGVSHAAPRRHFADRQALLDALAEAGFTRLVEEMRAAAGAADGYPARLRAAAAAYMRFAARDAALHELMFAAKNTEPSAALREAADRLFSMFGELIAEGQQAGELPPGDPDRLRLLIGATLQGIAALAASGRITPAQADALIKDELALLARARDLPARGRPPGGPASRCPWYASPVSRRRGSRLHHDHSSTRNQLVLWRSTLDGPRFGSPASPGHR